MALQFKGGQSIATERMRPLSKDVVARLDWMRQREARLKDALRTGEVEQARQWISDIVETAKPGEYNVEAVAGIQKALRDAASAITQAQSLAARGIVRK